MKAALIKKALMTANFAVRMEKVPYVDLKSTDLTKVLQFPSLLKRDIYYSFWKAKSKLKTKKALTHVELIRWC